MEFSEPHRLQSMEGCSTVLLTGHEGFPEFLLLSPFHHSASPVALEKTKSLPFRFMIPSFRWNFHLVLLLWICGGGTGKRKWGGGVERWPMDQISSAHIHTHTEGRVMWNHGVLLSGSFLTLSYWHTTTFSVSNSSWSSSSLTSSPLFSGSWGGNQNRQLNTFVFHFWSLEATQSSHVLGEIMCFFLQREQMKQIMWN